MDIIHKVKKQAKEWEKIFRNHISDKDLISRIYKGLLKQQQKDKQLAREKHNPTH